MLVTCSNVEIIQGSGGAREAKDKAFHPSLFLWLSKFSLVWIDKRLSTSASYARINLVAGI